MRNSFNTAYWSRTLFCLNTLCFHFNSDISYLVSYLYSNTNNKTKKRYVRSVSIVILQLYYKKNIIIVIIVIDNKSLGQIVDPYKIY